MESAELKTIVVHEAVLNLVNLLRLLNNCCFQLVEERLTHAGGSYLSSIYRGQPKDRDLVPFKFEWRHLTRELFLYSLDERDKVCFCVPVHWRMADILSAAIVGAMNRAQGQPQTEEPASHGSANQVSPENIGLLPEDKPSTQNADSQRNDYSDWRPWELVGC
jgi:hypothetical protein